MFYSPREHPESPSWVCFQIFFLLPCHLEYQMNIPSADKFLLNLIWPLSREIPKKNEIFRAHRWRSIATPSFSPPICSCPLTVDIISGGYTIINTQKVIHLWWNGSLQLVGKTLSRAIQHVLSTQGASKNLSSPGGLQTPTTCPPAGNLCAWVLHNKRQMNLKLHLIWSQYETDERL